MTTTKVSAEQAPESVSMANLEETTVAFGFFRRQSARRRSRTTEQEEQRDRQRGRDVPSHRATSSHSTTRFS